MSVSDPTFPSLGTLDTTRVPGSSSVCHHGNLEVGSGRLTGALDT